MLRGVSQGARTSGPPTPLCENGERRNGMSTQIQRAGKADYRLTSEVWLPRPVEEIFAFFSNAANLQTITPPWMQFRILTPQPIRMDRDALIDYRLQIRGIKLEWRSRITTWEPGERFVDEQVIGPYRFWRHEHVFVPHYGGTICRDSVSYAVPGGRLIHALFVAPDLRRVFAYRGEKLRQLFEAPLAKAPPRQLELHGMPA